MCVWFVFVSLLLFVFLFVVAEFVLFVVLVCLLDRCVGEGL